MPFANDLDLFINTLNDALDGPLDEAFVGLIRAKATEVFEPVYKATLTAPGAGVAPMTGGVPATPAAGAVVAKAKKAATAYNLFLKDYSGKHPGTANLMKVVGAVWKDMDDVAKAPFVEKAAQEKDQHDKANNMAVAQVAQVGQATTAPVAVAGTPAKKTPKKRGPTGYNVYTSETRTNKDLTMKEVGAMWKAMSAAEQQPYIDKAKAQATPPAVVATTK